ncbi:LysM peptidoglycan-binding domain-containing protein [Halomonas aquamarina]|uniref:LysM peptidoglycan-binding domain-containing protein n=1 Tax=Vreelandella aquamarina TaxID=77097 RepID=A0ACC5VXC5_9GAMM|nr:LysM domain-containing protein [Halomonas aquamarina]MBZ5488732.1 LysM peptidoglycan-binding domain-containing protein [Halomonas aquamarina]
MSYTVKSGDTLSGIAREKAISISSIMELNPTLDNPNQLRTGMELTLPETSEIIDSSCPDDIMADSPCVEQEEVEPGFYIVERPQTVEEMKNHLFSSNLSSEVNAMLERLNPQLGEGVVPGQVIVLSDPRSMQCTREETLLMQVASDVNEINADLTHEEAQRTVDYYNLLGAATGGAGAAIGNTAAGINNHTRQVKSKLEQLEQLYQRTYERTGRLNSPEFFASRRALFSELNTLLDRVTRMGLGIPEHPNLRHALGVTTKTTLHHWRQAGSSASGIPGGYADNYMGIANASKWISRSGYIGLGLSAVSSISNTAEACTTGRDEECQMARIREGASFGGSFIGGAAGGAAASYVAGGVCLALGVPTGGLATLACGVVLVGGAGYIGGEIGGEIGKGAGEWGGAAYIWQLK